MKMKFKEVHYPEIYIHTHKPHNYFITSVKVVASGLLSWGHLISSDTTDLIAQILFKLN